MFIVTLRICMVMSHVHMYTVQIDTCVQANVATCVQLSSCVYTSVHLYPHVLLLISVHVTCVQNACHVRVVLNLSLTCVLYVPYRHRLFYPLGTILLSNHIHSYIAL